MSDLAPATRDAVDRLDLGGRPLLVVDVDEVVLRFVSHLEAFIGRQGYRLEVRSFGITGNVSRLGSCRAVPAPEVAALIAGFFAAHVHDQDAVPGAAAALARLAARLAPDVPGTWLKTRDWAEVADRIEAELGVAPALAPVRS